MNPLKTILYTILISLSCSSVFAQYTEPTINYQSLHQPSFSENTLAYSDTPESSNPYNLLSLTDSTTVQQNTITYPPSKRDFRRLGYDSAMYLGAAVISFGILYAMPESVTNWDKEAMKENGIAYKWKQNVKAGPVWDNDDWVLNWITHPYSGGVYYMTARSSGFTWYESFLYSALMSTCFWEYGIEAFAEIPSKQDLIITPVLGSVVGEGFFYAKKSILKHDKRVLKSRFLGYTSLFLMDPFNTLLDSFGYKDRTQTQLGLAPVGFDKVANKAIWGVNLNIQF
ncbi:DUF3943 domain-containing protein [Flavobacterium gilvum]|uniref:DUF3943 domain-containing protein n=1 Tax=Flavobacterium gilvum TaxID=1492737 RepID=A0AAC9I603_9FLAO|nr:DUF3943 domain-containing protein [Flavobacterium gilvum]AOW10320.1 hypothetical protein EM308_12850 [Flavobacterium gilvum]KFC59791.1 hypothetical protein FEM08_14590 [Flavobacterium gilvum]